MNLKNNNKPLKRLVVSVHQYISLFPKLLPNLMDWIFIKIFTGEEALFGKQNFLAALSLVVLEFSSQNTRLTLILEQRSYLQEFEYSSSYLK